MDWIPSEPKSQVPVQERGGSHTMLGVNPVLLSVCQQKVPTPISEHSCEE